MKRQTLYLQLRHGYWRVRKPVPKLLIPIYDPTDASLKAVRSDSCNSIASESLAH